MTQIPYFFCMPFAFAITPNNPSANSLFPSTSLIKLSGAPPPPRYSLMDFSSSALTHTGPGSPSPICMSTRWRLMPCCARAASTFFQVSSPAGLPDFC